MIVVGLAGAIAVGFVCLWYFGLNKAAKTFGSPTPEEARIKHDVAEAKAKDKIKNEVQEIQHASIDDLERRARELSRRSKLPK